MAQDIRYLEYYFVIPLLLSVQLNIEADYKRVPLRSQWTSCGIRISKNVIELKSLLLNAEILPLFTALWLFSD